LAVGVESDQLVFDYLSRVGDLAQTALPAAQRMQLVAQLRNNIERERGGSDSTAAVRRILGRIGTPDEVVEAAAGTASGGGRTAARPEPTEPPPGSYGPYARPKAPPRQRKSADATPGAGPGAGPDGDPEDAADTRDRRSWPFRDARNGQDARNARGTREDEDDAPDWWRVQPRGGGRPRAGDELAGLPGMTGEVYIPIDD